ncbi:hypothetical protein BGW42_006536 [Actinomortierella wolfii]|nr:hypothetical protein BGW42_006536 [Actinomortierella wolfii]
MDLSDISDSELDAPRTRRRLISPEEEEDLEDVEILHGGRTHSMNAQRHGNSTNQRPGGFRSAFDMLRAEAHGSTTTTHVESSSSAQSRASRLAPAAAPVAVASETDEDGIDSGPTFKPETLHAIFKQVWSDPGTKAGKDALELSAEYLRLFTIEALHRATLLQREGEDEDLQGEKTVLELDSLESITPQSMPRRHLSSLLCCSCLPRRQRDNLSSRAFYPDQDSGLEDFSEDEYEYRHHHQYRQERSHPQGYFFKSHQYHHQRQQPRRQSRRHNNGSSSSSSRSGSDLEFGTLISRPYRDEDQDQEDNVHDEEQQQGGAGQKGSAKWPSQYTNGVEYSPRFIRRPNPFKNNENSSHDKTRRRDSLTRGGHPNEADDEYEDQVESDSDEESSGDEHDQLLGRAKKKACASYRTRDRLPRKNTLNRTGKEYDAQSIGTDPTQPYRIISTGLMTKTGGDGARANDQGSQQSQPPSKNQQQRRPDWLGRDLGDDNGEADAEEIFDVEGLIAEQERIARELAAQEEALRQQEEESIQQKRLAAIKAAEHRGLLRLDSDRLVTPTASITPNLEENESSKLVGCFPHTESNKQPEQECDQRPVGTVSAGSSFVGGEDAFNLELKMIDLALKKSDKEETVASFIASGNNGDSLGQDNIPSTITVSTQAAIVSPHTSTTNLALNGPSSSALASPLSTEPKRSVSSVSTSTSTSTSNHSAISPREVLSNITSFLKRVDGVMGGGDDGVLSDEASFSDQETALSKDRKSSSPAHRSIVEDYPHRVSVSKDHPHTIVRATLRDSERPPTHLKDESEDEERKVEAPATAFSQQRQRASTMDIPVHKTYNSGGNRERSSSDRLYNGLSSLLYTGASSLMGFFGGTAQPPNDENQSDIVEDEGSDEETQNGDTVFRHSAEYLSQPPQLRQPTGGGVGVGASLYASFLSRAKGLAPVTRARIHEEDEEDQEDEEEYGEELDYNF